MPLDAEMLRTFTTVRSVPLSGKTSAVMVPLPSRFRKRRSESLVSVLPM